MTLIVNGKHLVWLATALFFFWWMLGSPLTLAKPPVNKPASPRPAKVQSVTLDLVQAKLAEIQAKKDLLEKLKTTLLNLYQLAQNRLEAAQEFDANAASYQQAMASAPSETRRIRGLLAHATAEMPPEAELKPTEAPIPELEQQLATEEPNLTSLKNQLSDLDRQLHEQQNRPVKAREELVAAQQNLRGIEQDLKRALSAQALPLLVEAQQIVLRAQRQARISEITMLEQELLSYDVRIELLNVQRDLAARELPRAEARVKALRDAITERQQAEAEQARAEAERAEREALGKHPAIRRVVEENAALSEELAATVDRLGRTNAARESAEAQAKQIEQDFQSAEQKLEIAGLSQALGQVLREQRRKLPDVSRYHQDTKDRQAEIARVGLSALQVEEQRRATGDLEAVLGQIMSGQVDGASVQVDNTVPPEQRARIEDELRTLLKDQQGLLDRLAEAYTSYLRALGELDFAQRRLIDSAQGYAVFLDERLVWIPSARALGIKTVRDLGGAAAWLLAPSHWLQALYALALRDIRGLSQLIFAGLLLLALALLGLQRRLKAKIDAISAQVAKPYSDRFMFTLQALLLTILLAAPLPLLVATLGWRLQGILESTVSEFPRAVGDGLTHIALPLFFFIVFYRLCRIDGVAEDHFHWRESALKLLRRHLSWLIAVALPAMFITAVADWQAEEAHRDSLGRLAFIVSMIAFAVFAQRILRPKGGVFEEELRRNPRGWFSRLRYVWYPLGVGIPVALAGLAAVGYYYTARQLEGQLAATVWLVIGGVIAHDLVIRWLTLAHRKLALAQAREKREAARMAQAAQAGAEVSGEAAPIELEIHMVDLPTINEQTRQLTRIVIGLSVIVGLWFVWVQVLPALAILDQVTLWQHTVVVEGQERQQSITLANLALALVIGVVTVAAARNLPGVLEIAILQHLSIDAGSRYAITQVMRYVIFAVGISGAFNAIGGSWSQIQWVAAGLGVGLGFGLQEIFANFISGLIILLERPIRVGDTVTIRDISGVVSRIRMRTTTIIDGDRRALIVPNKFFITEQLINWSLDPMTRIVLKIGVAAGTDLALAQKLILETAKSLPQVLKEPEPTVYFMGVGESTLSFELRVYVKELEHRMPLMHALDIGLHEAFGEHDIRIRIPAA